ncbi:family 22 glycosyltransferase [Cryphonectria parasitica EP155]|uniref:Mannosyltransferase n=1 Tax=Cryphonectria parasitica (strain ATCC 38755 / EP155) TaxID=660469 RepID=A0A9P5CLR2_CRYP1|nr:family 22 glycosyltransferase [Cryphonectria parasitica EP155]KAF3762482.1 family 22 glycosyltransferase [Cryphonectria parasitica EP155]
MKLVGESQIRTSSPISKALCANDGFSVVILHLIAAPYTKVEESFNIQATHDVLVYGAPGFFTWGSLRPALTQKLSSFDHVTFSGAVPRTFIGPLILAEFSRYIIPIFGFEYAQLIARGLLGLFNASALVFLRNQIHKAHGSTASQWYAALQASQFHIMFYASRTLPNMFAFGLTTFAFGLLLPSNNPARTNNRTKLSLMLFVFSAVVFRSEVALLLAFNALWLLIIPLASLSQIIPPFTVSFILALAVSIPVDSYYWQKPLWPELWGFYYNVVQGSSSNWGTSPWYYYFTSALPKLLLNPLVIPLIAAAFYFPAYSRMAQRLVIPNLLFVAVYSLQPHKEARFIFYVVPPLTAAAALGATSLTTASAPKKDKGQSKENGAFLQTFTTLTLLLSILATFLVSIGMLFASSLNYPGGEALTALNALIRSDQNTIPSALVTVHADVLSCMTGVTLFGVAGGDNVPTRHNFINEGGVVVAETSGGDQDNKPAAWLVLDKTEDETVLSDPNFWLRFDYLLVEDESAVTAGQWDTIAVVEGLAGTEVLRPGTEPKQSEPANVRRVGRGAFYTALRDRVRQWTGGWWAGPRLAPKIRIMKREPSPAS